LSNLDLCQKLQFLRDPTSGHGRRFARLDKPEARIYDPAMNARRLTTLTSPAGGFGYNYDPVKLQRVTGLPKLTPGQVEIIKS